MKQLLIFILCIGLITSCNKSETSATTDPEPVANFTITNTIEEGVMMEGTEIVFDNRSVNADSYEWDFGNGITSAERNPRGVVLRPCGRTHTIRLIIRTRSGRTAVIIRTILVRCR
jgi:hypothetical protein